MTTPTAFRCVWCLKDGAKPSTWEQDQLYGRGWATLCTRCATKRLGNPYNALLPMRKIGA